MRFRSQHIQVKGVQICLIVMKPPLEKGCDTYFFMYVKAFSILLLQSLNK